MGIRIKALGGIAVVCGLLLGIASPARAVSIDVDLSGQFQQDNDVFTVNFSLDSDRIVTLFTSSWLSAGSGLGFDTAIFLWDSTGALVSVNDDAVLGGSRLSNGIPHAYGENDALLSSFLGAGDYTVTLLQTGNLPSGALLSNGFTQAGGPHYTRDFYGWGVEEHFNGAAGNDPRNGDWELHLVGISDYTIPGSTPIPEPTSLALLLMGAAGCGLRHMRNR